MILPTFINHALKIENYAWLFFASIFAIAIDILTLFPRLIAIPYAIYNSKKEKKHPLIDLIKNNPKVISALSKGILKIEVQFKEVFINPNLKSSKVKKIEGYQTVIIKKLMGEKINTSFKKEMISYTNIEGRWDNPVVEEISWAGNFNVLTSKRVNGISSGNFLD